MSTTGIILAGGKGRRMGGQDKGLVEFLGQPLVAHVIQRLVPQVDSLLINANRELPRYSAFGYPVISDQVPDFAGPLAGLHKGMLEADSAYVVTVPCDAPLLPSNLVSRLRNGITKHDADLAVVSTGLQMQPVFCLYRRSLLPSLEAYLADGGRKVEDWQNTLDKVHVAFDDNPRAFSNINTQEELAQLEKVA